MKLHHLLPPCRLFGTLLAVLALAASLPVRAAADCKPHPLFTPMQGYHAIECETSDFDAKEIPVRMISDHEAEKAGVGMLSDATTMGWLQRIFLSVLTF